MSQIDRVEQNDVINNHQQMTSKVYQSVFWDYSSYSPIALKTHIYLQYSKGQEINYILANGSIIKMFLFINFSDTDTVIEIKEKQEFLVNLEQIKYLQWQGEYEQYSNKKIGKWIAFWNGEILLDVVGGYYSITGLKQGLWKELNKNYRNQVEIYEQGEYLNGQRKGIWKYIFQNKKIGCGSYNDFGQKNGKWVELSKNFQKNFKVTYNGEYKNGIKVGIWNIVQQEDEILELIGCGLYDYKHTDYNGIPIKIGKWIELSEEFLNTVYVIYKGEYKNGKKVGQWDIYYKQYQNQPFKQIGGGWYDYTQDNYGREIKIGKWIELSDIFSNQCQVIYTGEYKNGKKIGQWDICFRQYYYQQFEYIGGGSYDQNLDCIREIKNGEWIELNNHFANDRQVIYQGKYNNGKKINRWKIYYKKDGSYYQNEQIGCEIYDQKNGLKIGRWTELSDSFNEKSEILYQGEYKENKKIGYWEVLWKLGDQYKVIGGGSYGYKEGSDCAMKIGKWIECSERFTSDRQVIYKGEYDNGNKIGRWDIQYRRRDRFEQIGGGLYEEYNVIKIGKWIELSDQFCYLQQLTFNGEYRNGIKVGKWEQMKRCQKDIEFIKIGEKIYDY